MNHLLIVSVLLLSSAQLVSALDPMIFPCFCKCHNDETKSKSQCAENEINSSSFDLIMRTQCVNTTDSSDDFWLGVTIDVDAAPTFHYVECQLPSWNFSAETIGGLELLHGVKNVKLEMRGERVNVTQLPREFFSNLADLKVVSLVNIGLHDLPYNLFWWSDGIVEINLSRNHLTTLPADLFRDTRMLQRLNLSFNDLRVLPDRVFSSLKQLVSLDLSRNHLNSISANLFNGLYSLQELNLEHSNLKLIEVDALASLVKLRVAKLSHNKLDLRINMHDLFGELSPFYNCSRLEELYLSHNNITKIYSDWTVSHLHLRKLDLSYNAIDSLQTEDLRFISDKMQVDLTRNGISTIDLSRLEFIAGEQNSSRQVIIDLNYNPIYCDCELYSLLRYIHAGTHPTAINFATFRMQELTCNGPDYLKGTRLLDIKTPDLKCILDNDESASYDSCIPDGICDCRFRSSDQTLIIDCAARNLTEAPTRINLGNANHVELDLSNNSMIVAPSLIDNGYEKVRSLNLARNQIVYVDEGLISPNLKTLKLNDNKLRSIDENILKKIFSNSSISLLTLHDNPWKCDIGYAALLSFVIDMYEHIPEVDDINCVPVKSYPKAHTLWDQKLDTVMFYILDFLLIFQILMFLTHLIAIVIICFERCFDPPELPIQNVPVLEEPLPGPHNV